MNATVWAGGGVSLDSLAGRALNASARLWFLMAVLGQAVFVYYVAAFYGGAAARGDFTAWNKALVGGYVTGDTMGNLALTAHLLLAVIITIGGPLQLIPQIRARAPSFHRWNGRIYLLTAVTASIAGLYLVWTRPAAGSVVQHVGISLNAVLIMVCAAVAVRHAMARDIKTHRRWALRLFMGVSGGWFFRVGLMFWIVVNKGPVGFDPTTFEGPFLDFLSFAMSLVPLAVLEIYLRVREKANAVGRFAMAGGLVVLTLAMSVGIFVAASAMWLGKLDGGREIVLLHIFAGLLAITAGAVALYALKGGPLHRKSGTIFVYAMLVMSGSGAITAIVKSITVSAHATSLKLQADATGGCWRSIW